MSGGAATGAVPAGLFETIAASFPHGLYVLRGEEIVFANGDFSAIFGHGKGSLISMDLFGEVYPDGDSVDLFRGVHGQVSQQQCRTVWEQPSARVDGTPLWIKVDAQPIAVGGEQLLLATVEDRTERRRTGRRLYIAQETLRTVLDAMEDNVYVVTSNYRIVYANRRIIPNFDPDTDYPACYSSCRRVEEPCPDCSLGELLASDEPMHREFLNDITGTWHSVIERSIRMPGLEGRAKLAVSRDITQRKETEEKIRALSHRLLTVQEEEKKYLSRELHDDLGQCLNAAKLLLDMLQQDLGEQPEGIRARLLHLESILQDSISRVRRLSVDLRPPILERLGLVETMSEHCKKIAETHGLDISFSAAGMKRNSVDNEAAINLFRILQEALHNVVKHAEAGRVKVRLVHSFPTVKLSIEDDGQGFDTSRQREKAAESLGLTGIAERVDLLGGRFRISSRQGSGTKIMVDVPAATPHTMMERSRS